MYFMGSMVRRWIFYNKQRITRRCSQYVNSMLVKLDSDINNNQKFDVPCTLKNLESISSEWPHKVSGQNVLSSVIHGLLKRKQHSDLNMLVNCLRSVKYDMWGGLSTVVLYSHLDQKMWGEALHLFEEMKRRDQIKHLRLYNRLISSLSRDNQLEFAYHYFLELQQKEGCLKTTRLKRPDFNMLKNLVESAIFHNNSVDKSDVSKKLNAVTVLNSVLSYVEKWGILVPIDLTNVLLKWFRLQDYSITRDSERCLNHTIPDDTFLNLANQIICTIQNDLASSGRVKDQSFLDQLLNKHDAFDVIVDAANILFRGSTKNHKVISIESLKNVLLNLNCSNSVKSVAVVFPQSLSTPEKMNKLKFLEDMAGSHILNYHLEVISLRKTHDDIVTLYLASRSELLKRDFIVVSNDSYYNHHFLVANDNEQKNQFFRWLRHRLRNTDNNGNVDFEQRLEPFIRDVSGNMRLICQSGHVYDIKVK